MCSGENSVPTWPFHCFDKSILTIDRSPELTAVTPRPSVKNTPDGSILESRAPTTPVALRPVSASHAPAVVSAPGAQFRKDCWHSQKPSFGRWLRKRQRFFRNWGPGADNPAGSWASDAMRALTGMASFARGDGGGGIIVDATEGVFRVDRNVRQHRHIWAVAISSRYPGCFSIPHGTHPPARKTSRPMYGSLSSYT